MEIRIEFVGGPLDGQTALTDGLDEIKVFFPPNERKVLAYVKFNEIVYAYDTDYSKRLTDVYDATVEFFGKHEPASLRFDQDPHAGAD